MSFAEKMFRRLLSNAMYRDTDINTAAYCGKTIEISYQKDKVLVSIISFSLSSDGKEKQQLRLTEAEFKRWVEEQSVRDRQKFARWTTQR